MEERRKLLLAMLDAVYVDTKDARSVVAIKPKAPFQASLPSGNHPCRLRRISYAWS